jgi:predicted aspartyl protease
MNQFFKTRWLGGAIVIALMLAAGSGVAVAANACGTVRLGEATVAMIQNAPFITLSANGAALTLLLDTGAQTTVLAPDAAYRIGARRPRIEVPREMQGIAGSLQTSEVELQSLTIAGVPIPWQRVRVAPLYVERAFSVKLDGVLGADTLSSFDIDIDLPSHRLALYQKQTCAGAGPAWTGPYSKILARRSPGNHLCVPVQLDGHSVRAFIDTGAQFSVMSKTAAAALGITDPLLAHDLAMTVHGAAAEQLDGRVHRFALLAIGTETIRNPEIGVTDLRLGDADLVLGVDFLQSQRVWMSYGSQQIFLSRRS